MSAILAPNPASSASSVPYPVPPRAVLFGVGRHVRGTLAPAFRAAGYDVVDADDGDVHLDNAAVVVVEACYGTQIPRLAPQMGRPLCRPFIIAVTGWWNENEAELRQAADALLHAPLREDEYRSVLDAVSSGVHDSALMSPMMVN